MEVPPMKRIPIVILVTAMLVVALGKLGTRTSASQGSPVTGRFHSPNAGQAHQALVPFTIQWELDNPAEVESQDIVLSTDGGSSFNLKIAAYLPPQQQQLLWSASPANLAAAARLRIVLRLRRGGVGRVDSDDFSISAPPSDLRPAPDVPAATVGAPNSSMSAGPDFAGTGNCVTGTLPVLNYNLNHILPCPSAFGGEPALAQDPNNPSRFQTVTGFATHLKSKNVDWGYSGSATARTLNTSTYIPRQDLTVEVAVDGTVYATLVAQSNFGGSTDTILIFRSTDGGNTFSTGIPIPKPVNVVDKPVIAVHPTNAQVLAVTFQELSGGSLFRLWVGIYKAGAAGNLGFSSNWVFFQPIDSGGNGLKSWLTAHPLIDPVATGSSYYWLFVVFTDDDFSGGPGGGPAGISVYKYQVDNTTQALANGGLPVQTLIQGLGYPLWTSNPSCRAIEQQLRVQIGCQSTFNKNVTKAAIDYCDPNSHRMYIPTLANTTGYFGNGLTSDLFMTVWTYSGGNQGTVTKRILPAEKEKYVACAATDGHGRVWVNAFIVTNTTDTQRAQIGMIAIDGITGDPGSIAYMSVRLPINTYSSWTDFFLGDYIYTQATWYSDPNNPGNVNGLGSRMAGPTWVDIPECGSSTDFWIELSGWN
jgi:hypothetical protein